MESLSMTLTNKALADKVIKDTIKKFGFAFNKIKEVDPVVITKFHKEVMVDCYSQTYWSLERKWFKVIEHPNQIASFLKFIYNRYNSKRNPWELQISHSGSIVYIMVKDRGKGESIETGFVYKKILIEVHSDGKASLSYFKELKISNLRDKLSDEVKAEELFKLFNCTLAAEKQAFLNQLIYCVDCQNNMMITERQ